MDLAVSFLALALAVTVGLWQWRVVAELRNIRAELERLRGDTFGG